MQGSMNALMTGLGGYLGALPGGGGQPLILLDRQVFLTAGTWTKPADGAGNLAAGVAYFVRVQLGGGGGSGARGSASGEGINLGCGGGAGGYSEEIFPIGMATETVSVTVGAAGSTSIASGGTDGGATLFGNLLSAGGGERASYTATYDDQNAGRGGYGTQPGEPGSAAIPYRIPASGISSAFRGRGGRGRTGIRGVPTGRSSGGDSPLGGSPGSLPPSEPGFCVVEVWGIAQ